MADTKDTALSALTGANVAVGDILRIADVSDTTTTPAGAGGSSKKITAAELALAMALLGSSRSTFNGASAGYTATASDRYIAQTGTMSAPRTVQLLAASAYPAGWEITIADESNSPTATNKITIARAGSDTILNEADVLNTTSIIIRNGLASFTLRSDGVSKWLVTAHGLQRPYFWWQDSPVIAVPDGIWTPQPWNVPQQDPFGISPGRETFSTTITSGSNGAVLPQATIEVASTAGAPTSDYIRITGPPGTGVDTIVGYTGKDATHFTGCNSTGTVIPTAGISTGTLATGQVVTGANVRWTPATPYLYNFIVQMAWAASIFGTRNVRVRDVSASPFFPIASGTEAFATGVDKQPCQCVVQPGVLTGTATYLQVEVWQSSGGVLNTAINGLESPSAMLGYGTAR